MQIALALKKNSSNTCHIRRMVYTVRLYALLAQLVERQICNLHVVGSTPAGGSKLRRSSNGQDKRGVT